MKTLKIVIPILISIAALYLATRNVNVAELKVLLRQVQFLPLLWALLIWTVAFTLRGLRWQRLLVPFQKIRVWPLVLWQIGGLFINNIVPLRLGEVARAYWTGHKTNVPKSAVFATIVTERILDVAAIAAIAVAVLFSLHLLAPEKLNLVLLAGGVGAAAVLAAAVLYKTGHLSQAVGLLQRLLPQKIAEALQSFFSGFHSLKNFREAAGVVVLSPLIWSVDICVVMMVSRAMDLNLSWIQAALAVIGLVLGVMIPAAPGAAGTYEAGGVAALSLIGIDNTRAFSFVLLLHAFQFIVVLIAGIPILLAEGFSPKALLATAEAPADSSAKMA